MKLTAENYYSIEANQEYLSVSQYKDFCGSLGKLACEAEAMAKICGEWEMKRTTPLLVGSYVDSYFEGTLPRFKQDNPEVFTQKGDLKSNFRKAEEIIERVEKDDFFMLSLSGEKQVIMTAEMFGAKWKIKMDSYLPGKAIVDLKVMSSLRKQHYTKDFGYMDFTQYWGYDLQGAVYQEVVFQNTGQRLPFYIAAVSKEVEPDIEVIQIDNKHLQEKLYEVEQNTQKIIGLKTGLYSPIRCELCDYCKHTKILTKPIHFSELLGEV